MINLNPDYFPDKKKTQKETLDDKLNLLGRQIQEKNDEIKQAELALTKVEVEIEMLKTDISQKKKSDPKDREKLEELERQKKGYESRISACTQMLRTLFERFNELADEM